MKYVVFVAAIILILVQTTLTASIENEEKNHEIRATVNSVSTLLTYLADVVDELGLCSNLSVLLDNLASLLGPLLDGPLTPITTLLGGLVVLLNSILNPLTGILKPILSLLKPLCLLLDPIITPINNILISLTKKV
ncbi:hypothetical protein CHUAL_008259 [Chamberlinius hualienensis]